MEPVTARFPPQRASVAAARQFVTETPGGRRDDQRARRGAAARERARDECGRPRGDRLLGDRPHRGRDGSTSRCGTGTATGIDAVEDRPDARPRSGPADRGPPGRGLGFAASRTTARSCGSPWRPEPFRPVATWGRRRLMKLTRRIPSALLAPMFVSGGLGRGDAPEGQGGEGLGRDREGHRRIGLGHGHGCSWSGSTARCRSVAGVMLAIGVVPRLSAAVLAALARPHDPGRPPVLGRGGSAGPRDAAGPVPQEPGAARGAAARRRRERARLHRPAPAPRRLTRHRGRERTRRGRARRLVRRAAGGAARR